MAESEWWRDSRLLLWWSRRAQGHSTAYHNDLYAKDLSKDVHVNEGTARCHTGNPQADEVENRYHHCTRSHYDSQWILMAPRAVLVMGRWIAFAKKAWTLLFEWPLTTRVEKKALQGFFVVVYLPFRDRRYGHGQIPSGKWQNNIVLSYSKQHLPGLGRVYSEIQKWKVCSHWPAIPMMNEQSKLWTTLTDSKECYWKPKRKFRHHTPVLWGWKSPQKYDQ